MQSNCIKEASQACLTTLCVVNHQAKPNTLSPPPAHQSFCSAILSSIQPNVYFTNHESLPLSDQMLSALLNACPNYSNTTVADHIRAHEYCNLANRVCLDYTGHGLFSYSQLHTSSTSTDDPFFSVSYNSVSLHSQLLLNGDKESEFQASFRRRVTKHMNLLEEDYSVVFTTNQSSAFKILAECYPFQSNHGLLTVYDYYNEAVEAMAEVAVRQGARVKSASFSWPDFRLNSTKLRKMIVSKSNRIKNRDRGLFAFPLQSRMTGSRYSYQWMSLARENGWHVLLDACALGAKDMETLGLSIFQPDFLISSFFKIFGHNPSGFCTLFVKKSTIQTLNPSAASIGIISINPPESSVPELDDSSSTSEIVEMEPRGVEFGCLDHADRVGLILISNRVRTLVNWLVNALLSLRHPNSAEGIPLVRVYGPRVHLDRGPAVAFNVYDWKGEPVEPSLVQKLADRNGIAIALGFLWGEEKNKIETASVVVGMLNDFGDVHRVWGFLARFLDADFVEKERWRYTALNQTTLEL